MYLGGWRGKFGGVPTGSDVVYTFDAAFSVGSSNGLATVTSNTLAVTNTLSPGSTYYQAVLQFTGPVSTLQIDSSATGGDTQPFTFAYDVPAPAPATLPLLALGVLGMGLWRRRKPLPAR